MNLDVACLTYYNNKPRAFSAKIIIVFNIRYEITSCYRIHHSGILTKIRSGYRNQKLQQRDQMKGY